MMLIEVRTLEKAQLSRYPVVWKGGLEQCYLATILNNFKTFFNLVKYFYSPKNSVKIESTDTT